MESYPAANVKSAKVKKTCFMEAGKYFLCFIGRQENMREKSIEAVADYEG